MHTYSAEEMELAGFFSKLKKTIKRAANPIKQIKHDLKKLQKPLSKLAPLSPALAFIPVVGTGVALAAKLAAARNAQRNARGDIKAQKRAAAEVAKYEAEIKKMQQENPEQFAPAPMTQTAFVPSAQGSSAVPSQAVSADGQTNFVQKTAADETQSAQEPSFLEQYKTPLLIGAAGLALVAVIGSRSK